jgi:zinc transporter, ZIP family
MDELGLLVAVSGGAALVSIAGGWFALRHQPTTLSMSVWLGLAGGVLLGTVAFEMIPKAITLASKGAAMAGFACGIAAIYAFELLVRRGRTAGIHAAQRRQIRENYRVYVPKGDDVTVLAGGTAAEELIEGLSIGAGAALEPSLAMILAASIALDNLSESLSIGSLIAEKGFSRRIDAQMLKETAFSPDTMPNAYICGLTSFVEAAGRALVLLGHDEKRIKTERFGPTGG